MNFRINKSAQTVKAAVADQDYQLINQLARVELKPEDVYVFSVRACDNQVDRDDERFTEQCLAQLVPMFKGKPVLFDHWWSASKQTARIFDTALAKEGDVSYLQAKCYMLRAGNDSLISAIDGGIIREVSVGCAIGKATCSVCGELYYACDHRRGQEYDGKRCVVELSEPKDAYELSFVAVPAQREAGVEKGAKNDAPAMTIEETKRAYALLELENKRFGG